MGRLHSNGKGISASAIPYSRTPPAWLKTTPEQVVDQICKLAKKGATPSQIGVVLRDSHGIAQVKVVTGGALLRSEKQTAVIANISCQVTRFCAFSSPMVRFSMNRMPSRFRLKQSLSNLPLLGLGLTERLSQSQASHPRYPRTSTC